MPNSLKHELIRIGEACKILNCHPNTLHNWEEEGLIVPIRLKKNGHRRYRKSDILKLLTPSKEMDGQQSNSSSLDLHYKYVEAMPQMAFIANKEGSIVYYNQRWYDYVGNIEGTENWGWKDKPIHHPQDRQRTLEIWQRSLEEGVPYEIEYRLRRYDGQYRWHLGRAIPITDENGEIVQWFGTNTDIHLQKMNKLTLEESQEYLDSVFQSVTDGIAVFDMDGNLITLNQAEAELVGYESKEDMLKNLDHFAENFELFTPDKSTLIDISQWPISRAMRGETFEDYKLWTKRVDFNLELFVSFSGSPVRNKKGEQTHSVIVSRNITSRKEDEVRAAKDRAIINTLFNANIVGIIFWNIEGAITDANDNFLNTIGYTRTDLRKGDIDWINMTPKEYKKADREAVKQLYTFGSHPPVEKEYFKKDGTRVPVLVASTFLNDEQEEGVGFVLDISKRKKLEAQKDEFIAVASHELKTPITSLKAYIQVLQKLTDPTKDPKSLDFLSKMETQTDKLTQLVKDLLDVTKIQAGQLEIHFQEFDLVQLAQETIELTQLTTSHDIILNDKKPIFVHADRDRIGQVISNFLSNAIKYSPKAGKVYISIKVKNDQVIFSVQDYGIGIPQDEQNQIFQKFYRAGASSKTPFSGLGLGLYISHEIIKRHEGTIGFKSKEEEGSTFYFSLPLHVTE